MNQALTETASQFGDAGTMAKDAPKKVNEGTPARADEDYDTPDKPVYAGREWTSEHPLNLRISIPIGFGRYYVTLVAGRERRARARLALDRRQNPLDTPTNVFFLAFITTIATAGSITFFYFLLAHAFGWSGRLML